MIFPELVEMFSFTGIISYNRNNMWFGILSWKTPSSHNKCWLYNEDLTYHHWVLGKIMKTNIYIYIGFWNFEHPMSNNIFFGMNNKTTYVEIFSTMTRKCQKLFNQSQPSTWLEVSTRPKCPRKLTVSTANRDLTTTHEDWSNQASEFKQLHKQKVVRKTWGYILQSVFPPGYRTETRPNMAKQHTMKMAEQSKISPGWVSINRCKISSTIWNINCRKQHVFSYKTLVSRTLNKFWPACLRWSSHIFFQPKG